MNQALYKDGKTAVVIGDMIKGPSTLRTDETGKPIEIIAEVVYINSEASKFANIQIVYAYTEDLPADYVMPNFNHFAQTAVLVTTPRGKPVRACRVVLEYATSSEYEKL